MQALWMLLAALLFSVMSVAVKYASAGFSSAELVMFRGLVGVAMMAAVLRAQGVSLRTDVLAQHAWRSLVGVLSLGGWFYSIAHLDLATATTLNFTSSVWIGAFITGAALLRRREPGQLRRQGPLLASVLIGFAGVALLLRPALESEQWVAGLVGLLSGLTSGWAYMLVSGLGRACEPASRTVFYFALGSTLGGALATLATGLSAWSWPSAVWLLPIGVLASLGQWCLTRAYSHGATLVVANLQYAGVIFAVALGALLFDEAITWHGWLGMALIVASGIAATALRGRAAPDAVP
jgi:S-adenosylmethionine uptake transporter